MTRCDLNPAGSGQNDLRFGVIDADGQFPGGKTPEDHGMDGPQAGAGQHGQDGFRDHGHIDDDGIPFLDPQSFQKTGDPGNPVQELLKVVISMVLVTGLS